MSRRLRFDELEGNVPSKPGIYEIYMLFGEALKVGVGKSLLQRLKDHRASRQGGLKLKPNGDWNDPSDVDSKKSILAKHLFFDSSIAKNYDLTLEVGRRRFLGEQCYFVFEMTDSREEAKRREKFVNLLGTSVTSETFARNKSYHAS